MKETKYKELKDAIVGILGICDVQNDALSEVDAIVDMLKDQVKEHEDRLDTLDRRLAKWMKQQDDRFEQHRRNHEVACPLCDETVLDDDLKEE